ncbi:hypothetical protein IFM89_037048 [Coptis chinensis]|uniref:WW domain-containing protein n=1 Tax=Coptis chinensis TaxID=261450 RepID=A0A835HAV8_9MAGN|nr:hypothetical protein IFM89_037048 [Coptis chinensis]
MASSEGPQYAPEDPTLLKPWKGLIDGTSGVLYYWNPESNVTQYERPEQPAPPSVSVSAPKLAPIPMARSVVHNNGTMAPPGQEFNQYVSQGQQQMFQPVQQQGQFNKPPQYQSSYYGEDTQHQQTMQMGQGVQPNKWQPMQQQPREQMLQQQQQPGNQMPQQFEQPSWQHEVPKQSHLQGQQFLSQQQQIPPQATLNMPGQQIQPQSHQGAYQQGQQIQPPPALQGNYQQGQQVGFSPREESKFQRGKETGFSPSMINQPGTYFQNRPETGAPVQPQPHRADPVHQQSMGRPMFQSQPGSGFIPDQQPGGRSMGLKMGYGDDMPGRAGNTSYFNANNRGGAGMVPQLPNLATVPVLQNPKEMGVPHFIAPGHANGSSSVTSPAMAQMNNHVTGGQPFSRNAVGIPPGSLDPNLSAVDMYRREHEVTATGDNVPVPFMSFEATGFPPEILREVSFLLSYLTISTPGAISAPREEHMSYTVLLCYPDTQLLLCPSGAAKTWLELCCGLFLRGWQGPTSKSPVIWRGFLALDFSTWSDAPPLLP